MLPNKLEPNPVLGAGDVAGATATVELLVGVCPNAEPPNRGFVEVAADAAPCPKTLPASNPVGVADGWPKTGVDPKAGAGATVLCGVAGAGLPKVDWPNTEAAFGVDVIVVETGWPKTVCPKADPKGLVIALVGWPNREVPVLPVVVTGRPNSGAATPVVVLLAAMVFATVAVPVVPCVNVWVDWALGVGAVTTSPSLLWPNRDVKPVLLEVVVACNDAGWPNRLVTAVAVVDAVATWPNSGALGVDVVAAVVVVVATTPKAVGVLFD